MNETPKTPDRKPDTPDRDPERPAPRRLLRSRDDRMLAGVAGGIASYLNVDPTLVRVAFVATTIFGGIGLVAYLVFAALTPADDGTGAPVQGGRPSLWLVIAAVIAVCLILPGPFWASGDWGGGWLWGGSLWLLLLVGAGAFLFMTLRDRRRDEDGTGGDENAAGTAAGATAETKQMDASEQPQRGRRNGWSRLLRAVVIAVAVVVGLNLIAAAGALSAWATATGHGVVVGGVVIALGAVLIGAAVLGNARWRWLIFPALILALPAGAVAAADVRFDGDVGEREYAPATRAAIPTDGYSLGVGEMTVDLRELPWRRGAEIPVRTEMGVGQTVVAVPDRVCVDPDARASVGEVLVRGSRSSGLDAEQIDSPPRTDAPRLVLDSEIEAGQIAVTDGPPEAITKGRRFGPHNAGEAGDDAAARVRATEACAR